MKKFWMIAAAVAAVAWFGSRKVRNSVRLILGKPYENVDGPPRYSL